MNPELTAVGHAAVLADARIVVAGRNRTRGAGLELRNAAKLPAAKHLACGAVLVFHERQLVDVVDDHDVANIEIRLSPQVMGIVCVGDDVALGGAIVHALGEGVRHAKPESVSEAAIPTNL